MAAAPLRRRSPAVRIYVGYAAISDQTSELLSEIRLATSTDCGDSWSTQLISQPTSLNQGASVSIDPITGDVHVGWRRFDTVEAFLGVPSFGCPETQSFWRNNPQAWPVESLTIGVMWCYTRDEAIEVLNTRPRGDVTISLARQLIVGQTQPADWRRRCRDRTRRTFDVWWTRR